MQSRSKKFLEVWEMARPVLLLGWLFGVTSLAWSGTTGDFNGDGFTDLAIGVPVEDVGSISNAGVMHIFYGSVASLTATGNQRFSQDTTDMRDVAEDGDAFEYVFEISPLR
jgi:hypothetical protein